MLHLPVSHSPVYIVIRLHFQIIIIFIFQKTEFIQPPPSVSGKEKTDRRAICRMSSFYLLVFSSVDNPPRTRTMTPFFVRCPRVCVRTPSRLWLESFEEQVCLYTKIENSSVSSSVTAPPAPCAFPYSSFFDVIQVYPVEVEQHVDECCMNFVVAGEGMLVAVCCCYSCVCMCVPMLVCIYFSQWYQLLRIV